MSFRLPSILAILLLIAAGCTSPTDPTPPEPTDDGAPSLTKVRDRHTLPFDTSGGWSKTLAKGGLGQLPVESVFVDVDVPLGNGLPSAKVHMGVFRPDVPEGVKVPVVADVGPYYGEPALGDVHATEPANRLGKFLIENLVPHGYAIAQVSVFGTGDSGGCMDLMGEVEQAGVQAAVKWLGEQEWSNGNVGLIGRSYDGSTPWEAAMVANDPHLKTVVPISGLYGQHDLMWRNGSAETRGPGVLWGLYYAFTYTGNEQNPDLQATQIAENTACPDTQTGGAQGLAAYGTGDYVAPEVNEYWTERSFKEEVLANYEGSVYFIHGLQDWNVDPHMAFPFYQELESKSLEVKGLFGQWGHMYPDRPGEHDDLGRGEGQEAYPESVRWDWAQDLLEWFDHYLKGTGPKPELHVEVQDAQGRWRIEETYPPADRILQPLKLGADFKPSPDNPPALTPDKELHFAGDPVAADTRIAGLSLFHVKVTPGGSGGQIYAELRDKEAGLRIGHAIMDLRFAEGGKESKPVQPGMPLVARMEFFAADYLLQAGHSLELVVANTGRDYLPSSTSAPIIVDATAASVLYLSTIETEETAFFQPPSK